MGKPGGTRSDRKKLSWTYRNKKRQGKTRKHESTEDKNVQVQNKKARIIVRNLSFKIKEEDVRNLYEPFGEIEQIDLLKRPDGKPVGCGFVQFKRIEDASKAIFQTNKNKLLGRPINVAWAIPKSKFVEQLNKKADTTGKEAADEAKEEQEESEEPDVIKLSPKKSEEPFKHREKKKLTPEERKLKKLEKRKKRARIVIRNLPFKATEKHLRELFSQYGNIEEIQLLSNSDGKRVGCGFVQFEHVQSAAKAIHYSNLKTLLDRQIVVDWALSKSKFAEAKEEVEVKEEKGKNDEVQALDDDDDDDDDVKPLVEDSIKEESEEDDTDVNDEAESSDDEENESSAEFQEEEDEKPLKSEFEKRPRVISHDVNEGKTVFLKNVPFSVKNEELRACMEQFGPVYYALVCMDSLTEHSKGTAFVKFVNVEDAEKCLSSGTELQLHGQTLDPHRAIDRKDVQNSKNQQTKQIKDTRNLYLVKEGVILAGSPAAADVSAGDMAKRLQMEQWKSQMLRNLNMFVSRVRLVVHNLPETLDDLKLREIFKKYAGTKAIINEARVMRDLKNPDANGIGKSKEFGFVGFTNHEDALRALRSVNNNPNIFSKGKRPIVAFSIENRVMVNAKARRVQKSKDNNPLWKGKREGSDAGSSDGPAKRFKSESFANRNENRKNQQSKTTTYEIPEFSGVTGKPGEKKMRSKFNLKTQAQLHAKTKKDEKKQRKIQRKFVEIKANEKKSRREIKPKQGFKKLNKEEANLDRLVENYRSRLSAVSSEKSKWYNP